MLARITLPPTAQPAPLPLAGMAPADRTVPAYPAAPAGRGADQDSIEPPARNQGPQTAQGPEPGRTTRRCRRRGSPGRQPDATLAAGPPPALPGEHFAAAFAAFVLGGLGLVWAAPDLGRGAFLAFRVIGVAHLFTLGWITTTIMGVLYQFLPVALGVAIRSQRLAHATFAVFFPGVLLFASGTALARHGLMHAGVGLVALGVLAFVANLGLTLARAKERGLTWWGLAVGATNLVAVLAVGAALAANLATGWLGAGRLAATAAHAHLAVLGWVMPVVVGVGHRLLPMFLLAHESDERPAAAALVLLGGGAPLLAAGLGSGRGPLAAAGFVLTLAGVLAFALQVWLYLRHRRKPTLDVGMRIAVTGAAGLTAASLLAPAVFALGARASGLVTAYGVIGLLGGVSLFVVGHYYKIVPFLTWYHRFASLVGTRPVPRVADLVAPRPASIALGLLVGGALAIAAGALGLGPRAARAGAFLFAAGAGVVAAHMAAIVRPHAGGARQPAGGVTTP